MKTIPCGVCGEDNVWADDGTQVQSCACEPEECPDNCVDKVPLNGYYYCHYCGAEWFPEDE